MKVRRSYLVRVVEIYEGDPPPDWDLEEDLDHHQDQYVCDNWKLVDRRYDHDTPDLLRDDGLEYEVVT